MHRPEILHHPDLRCFGTGRAQRFDRQTVRNENMMRDLVPQSPVHKARRHAAVEIGFKRHSRFVVSAPETYAVAQTPSDNLGVACEKPCGFKMFPATSFPLQRLWEIPMVQGQKRLDSTRQQAVHQTVVVVQPGFVDISITPWNHSRPGHRKAIGVKVQRLHQVEVFFQAVVLIAGHPGVVSIGNAAGFQLEAVPYAGPFAVFVKGAFHLVGAGSGSPKEGGGEYKVIFH